MVDEEWLYLTSDAMATLIEDVDVFIYPKARRKAHVEKITSLSALGQPQKVIKRGEEIDQDRTQREYESRRIRVRASTQSSVATCFA